MTFTLPMRTSLKSPSNSVTLLPAFTLCYEDKPEALAHLLEKKTPLPLKNLFTNNEFMAYVITKEPGPSVQYENLRPALTALRPWLRVSANGSKLLTFYKDFLQLHGQWVVAAAELAGFEIHTQLMHALHLHRGDETLMAHLKKHIPQLASKLATTPSPITNRAGWDASVKTTQDKLKSKAFSFAERLHALKTSDTFWTQHGRLLAAIELSEKKLRNLRAANAGHTSHLGSARRRNDRVTVRQLGTSGTIPHPPHVEESIRDFTKEEKASYFNFNETVVSAAA
ncbi:uncharacterized protein A1O9_08877 [Exophiala aquamarina CBS 119918]|uniref:Uncharacterized protein n=1 Tax=Exophiala aquamarina CBS 119918 TaxID=1182545 RepID=A0A072P7H2_9EURO|nr:uncharacterized protein A1O9_08877 [Exophiala aquamarina CBS 119918]KEF55223.1 hypothetical protein A1O9_08877 [Exophiala aquamarina CBS 119918]